MTRSEIKSKIDALWLDFHSGGITNPITVIEQISYLMFLRLLDLSESREEKKAARLGKTYEVLFPKKTLRWSHFRNLGGEAMLAIVRDEVFPFLRTHRGQDNQLSDLGRFFKDATFLIPTANLLNRAVNAIDALPLEQGDTKGDLYEYLLSKLATAGIAGQFRTPRHIIRAMVEILDPKPSETICDPAAGTAGFLVGSIEYLREKFSSPNLVEQNDDGSRSYPGDLLEPYAQHFRTAMFHGFDFDSTMLRIAAMNLRLHGVESMTLHSQDTLTSGFAENHPQLAHNHFDVILANPPFKGTIDHESTDATLKSKVKTKKSELLFLVLILRLLKPGGRAAVIVPDGVLFGSSQAHLGVRKMLIDDNQLEAVISLPAGVFKPYAGVSTAILVFTKAGRTDDVWFYDVQADGFSLDDKRTPQPDKNDLPDLVKQWKSRNGGETRNTNETRNAEGGTRKDLKSPTSEIRAPRSGRCFFVPVADIRANKYDLSLNRYKESKYEEATYDPPNTILSRMRELEQEILEDIDELERMLR